MSLHPSLPAVELEQLDASAALLRKLVSMFGAAPSCFPKLVFRRDPAVGPRSRALRAPAWHDWVVLDPGKNDQEVVARCSRCFKTAFGEERPMLGRRGLPTALRRVQGAESERGHLLCTTMRQDAECAPLLFCFRCGAYTSKRCYKFGGVCDGEPGPCGRGALKRIRQGLHPHYRSEETVAVGVGTTCRASARYVLLKAAQAGSASSPARASLISTPGMEALAERIRQREAAAKAAVIP